MERKDPSSQIISNAEDEVTVRVLGWSGTRENDVKTRLRPDIGIRIQEFIFNYRVVLFKFIQ